MPFGVSSGVSQANRQAFPHRILAFEAAANTEENMTISERTVGAVRVLDLDGQLKIGDASAQLLSDKVRSLLQQGEKRLLVNLQGVSYMDSAGLGELVQAFATTARQGGSLKLLNTTARLHDLLTITKLATVFELHDNESAAVASFT